MPTPVVLGFDFGGTKIAIAVADTSGNRLSTSTIDTHPERGARDALARAVAAGRGLLAAGREPIAIGASTMGIPRRDGIALAPAVPGWADLALARELSAAFGVEDVLVATDVKAAATAEAAHGALAGRNPGLYVNLGTGLAAAIVVDGEVVTGRNGAAGEIGYNLRTIADVGQRERVLLEEAVGGRGFHRISGGAVADLFAATDPDTVDLLNALVSELSFHLVNLAIAVDPERIVVGGGMVRSWHQIEGGLRRALQAGVPYPPDLVISDFPFDAPLIGALALGTTAARARLTRGAPAWAG